MNSNPYLIVEREDSDKRMNVFANMHSEIKLPIEGLEYKINFSQNYRTKNMISLILRELIILVQAIKNPI
jgi:hypothetical protein